MSLEGGLVSKNDSYKIEEDPWDTARCFLIRVENELGALREDTSARELKAEVQAWSYGSLPFPKLSLLCREVSCSEHSSFDWMENKI